jgi:hypothetical protein
MSITEFKIGEKFPLAIQAAGDGGLFQYDVNGASFILKLSRFDLIAIEAFRTGKIELGLFSADNLFFFLYKIDGIFNAWGDCPFTVHTLNEGSLPKLDGEQNKDLSLYFIDSRTDMLLAMRTVRLSDAFWRALDGGIKAQLDAPQSSFEYSRRLQAVWQKFSSESMAENAAVRQEIGVEIQKPSPIKH